MALFTIKDVKYTTLLKTNEEFKISGTLPFPLIGPMWVNATITFPPKTIGGIPVPEILGYPTITKTAFCIGGNFTFVFPAPTGMDREGDYKLDLNAYLGPETQIQLGGISSKNYSIPPFPPIASVPTVHFTESGSGPANAVAFQMGALTINPSSVVGGQTTVLTLPITNIGSQDQSNVTVKMEVDEMGATDLSLPGTSVGSQTFGPYTIKTGATQNVVYNWKANGAMKGKWLVASVFVNGTLSPNTGPTNPNIFKQQFEIVQANVSNVSITASPAVASIGQQVVLTINFTTNAAQLLKLSGYILDAGYGSSSTRESSDFSKTINAIAGQNSVTVNTTAKDGGVYSGGQSERKVGIDIYDPADNDLYGNVFANVYHVQQAGAGVSNVSVSASPSVATAGQNVVLTVNFNFGGTTNQTLQVTGQVYQAGTGTESNPEVGSQFTKTVTAVPGPNSLTVNLAARDGGVYSGGQSERKVSINIYDQNQNNLYGNVFANVYHEQKASTVVPSIDMTFHTVVRGTNLSYSFLNFPANTQLYLTVQGQGSAIDYPMSNNYGNGNSDFLVYLDPGVYTIILSDNAGHSAPGVQISVTAGDAGGGSQVSAVQINIKNTIPSVTYWTAKYWDPVTQQFVEGGNIPIDGYASFNHIYPGGYIAVFLWDGQSWSSQYNSNTFQPTTGSEWVYDWRTNTIDFTYRP